MDLRGAFFLFTILFSFAAYVGAGDCSVKDIKTYTTQDASILTSLAYIAEFKLSCAEKSGLTAVVAGSREVRVAVGPNGGFQIGWVEEVAKETRGDHKVELFNEEGLSTWRKKPASATPIASFVVNHPGAYTGPWLNSEHIAALIGALVLYVALTSKNKLLN